MKILFFGDIVGKVGRTALASLVHDLKREYEADLIIANGENMAHGQKITPSTVQAVLEAGVDVITSGDHHKKAEELAELSAVSAYILRPANYPPEVPGTGSVIVKAGKHDLLVVNLMGRVFMRANLDCPFRTLDAILAANPGVRHVLVDFHAEATSEKAALAWYADGRVSALVGTHTHVPTADARIFPGGTAFVSDVGMVGPRDTVIGVTKEIIITSFLTQLPLAHELPEHGMAQINAVCVTVDDTIGKATSIVRVDRELEV